MYPSKVEWDLTNGNLSKLLGLLVSVQWVLLEISWNVWFWMSLFSRLRQCCDVAVWRNPSPPGQKQSAINRWTGAGNFGIQKIPVKLSMTKEMMLCYIIVVLGPDRVGNWWCAYTWATNRNTLLFKLTGRMGDFTFLMIEAETSCVTHSKSTSQDFYLAHIVVHSQHLFRKTVPPRRSRQFPLFGVPYFGRMNP